MVFIAVIFLTGCSYKDKGGGSFNVFSNRDITRAEIDLFTPINYETVKSNNYSDLITIEKIVLNNIDYYLVPFIPIESLSDSKIKLFLLKYDSKNDRYEKIDEYSDVGNVGVRFVDVDDINDDGHKEFFVSFWEGYGGSGTAHYFKVIKIKDDKIVEIFSVNHTKVEYDKDSRIITGASFIWGENETHFGCHYWTVNKYFNINGDFKTPPIERRTKYKYDFGDEYGIDYENCFPLPYSLSDMI